MNVMQLVHIDVVTIVADVFTRFVHAAVGVPVPMDELAVYFATAFNKTGGASGH